MRVIVTPRKRLRLDAYLLYIQLETTRFCLSGLYWTEEPHAQMDRGAEVGEGNLPPTTAYIYGTITIQHRWPANYLHIPQRSCVNNMAKP
jgi:hypothetical protein